MNICGEEYKKLAVYEQSITIPDSFVLSDNKTGKGNGEAKLYMGSKDSMRMFYTGSRFNKGFKAKCFVLKKDLQRYLKTIEHEYRYPSIKYRGMGEKKSMHSLWLQRKQCVESLDDILIFEVKDQDQIKGNRGYVNCKRRKRKSITGYDWVREILLPFVSYVSIMKVQKINSQEILFYWRPFADFTQMASMQFYAQNYGKKKLKAETGRRRKQLQYREMLYQEFTHCPFSKIDDFRLLVASHIKPYAVSTNSEKADPDNGLMLSPLYDKLFDRGFVSFEDDGTLMISDWLSEENKNRIDFNYLIDDLKLNDKRRSYLEYHRNNVFK